MKRLFLKSACSTALLAGVLMLTPAHAQDTKKKQTDQSVVVEVAEDGTVTINGKAVEGGGEVIVKMKDGTRETVRVFKKGEGGDALRFRGPDAERLIKRKAEVKIGDPDHNVFFYRKDEGNDDPDTVIERVLRGNGNAFFMDDEGGRFEFEVFADNDDALNVFGNRMRLGGPTFEAESTMMKGRMEIMKLEREAMEIAQQFRRASGDERAALEADLDAQLDAIFERKMELRQQEIDRLTKRLAEQQAAYDERMAQRDNMIERRKKELLGQQDALDW